MTAAAMAIPCSQRRGTKRLLPSALQGRNIKRGGTSPPFQVPFAYLIFSHLLIAFLITAEQSNWDRLVTPAVPRFEVARWYVQHNEAALFNCLKNTLERVIFLAGCRLRRRKSVSFSNAWRWNCVWEAQGERAATHLLASSRSLCTKVFFGALQLLHLRANVHIDILEPPGWSDGF